MTKFLALELIHKAEIYNNEALDLSNLGLWDIPDEVWKLKNLESLWVSGNNITSISPQIINLKKLKELVLSSNKIQELDENIFQLTNLKHLDLANNFLTRVSPSILNLKELMSLFLDHNRLSFLPSELIYLPNLQRISLEFNIFPMALMQAYNHGWQNLRTYLASLICEEDVEFLFEAKCVFIGEGGVGKSSLIAAIKNEPYIYDRKSSHPVEISHFYLPHPHLESLVKFNIWDFGGQIVYRVTNQFFYTPKSIYVLVWDIRQDVIKCDVEGWIKKIFLKLGEAAKIIIVASHCRTDQHVPHEDRDYLKNKYGNVIVGFCEIDSGILADGITKAQNGDASDKFGISELKNLILSTALKLPQMGWRINKRWMIARDRILSLNNHNEILPFISYKDFEAICLQDNNTMNSDEIKTLARLMHDLGNLLYFGEYEDLRGEVILQPDWVTKAIGYILEDSTTINSKGELDHKRLGEIWNNHDLPDREIYDPKLFPYFLRLMEYYEVSYRLENNNKSLVAQLVPDCCNDLPWHSKFLKGIKQVNLVCHMQEEPDGIIPWMIVRTHYYSTPSRHHWKRGMYLENRDYGSALLEWDQCQKDFFIKIKAKWPPYFMSILHDTLSRLIEDRWPGLNKEFYVPCNNVVKGRPCEGRFILNSIYELMSLGDNSIRCQVCLQKHSLNELVSGFIPPVGHINSRKVLDAVNGLHDSMEGLESRIQENIVMLTKIITTESMHGPSLFSILPIDNEAFDWNSIGKKAYRLNLWCEMPGAQHPTCLIGSEGEGEYIFHKTKEWVQRVAPYVIFTNKIVSFLIENLSKVSRVTTFTDSTLRAMFKIISEGMKFGHNTKEKNNDLLIKPNELWKKNAEGAALRELHELLLELDVRKRWGNLNHTRKATPTGDFLWLCPDHLKIYDPGEPILD